jgi:predicted transposase YdaD
MKLDFCAVCGSTNDLHQHHIEPVVYSRQKRGSKRQYNPQKKIEDCSVAEIFACLFDRGVISEDGEITVCYYHHNLLHGIMRFQRVEHSNLIKEGLERAKRSGKKLGRPRLPLETRQQIPVLHGQGLSYSKIAKELNISKAVISRELNSHDFKDEETR